MKHNFLKGMISSAVFALGVALAPASHADITGAGATFPYPVYAKWAETYKGKTGVGLNYQAIGSGGGIKQIQAKTVDFGASDLPLKPDQLEASGLVQFPTVIGGAVPVVHLDDITSGQLKLSGKVLADIYLGKITKWNDPAIAALNPGLKLPTDDVIVVHRSDGSGTSAIWTNYLSKVSDDWKSKVGEGTAVSWPVGLGGKGNEGIASYVSRVYGAIGYVELAYAVQNHLTTVALQNKAGNFVQASPETFAAAAAGADWKSAPGLYLMLTDQAGQNAWPVSGATFILVYKKQAKPDVWKQVQDFFTFGYSDDGDALAKGLLYVPLPDSVTDFIKSSVWSQVK